MQHRYRGCLQTNHAKQKCTHARACTHTHTHKQKEIPKPNTTPQQMALLLCICKVPGSYFSPETNFHQKGILCSCLLPPCKCQNSLPTKAQSLPSTLFPIQYSMTSLTLNAVKYELQKVALNNI
jgi:hypothetical protein